MSIYKKYAFEPLFKTSHWFPHNWRVCQVLQHMEVQSSGKFCQWQDMKDFQVYDLSDFMMLKLDILILCFNNKAE